MIIYVFGNPVVEKDSLPLKLLPYLKKAFSKIEFKQVDPNENFPPEGEKDLIILDTVLGIKKSTLLDLNDLAEKEKTPISLHDYDLLLHLLLLKKMKKIDRVTIIGIPADSDDNALVGRQVTDLVKRLKPRLVI